MFNTFLFNCYTTVAKMPYNKFLAYSLIQTTPEKLIFRSKKIFSQIALGNNI